MALVFQAEKDIEDFLIENQEFMEESLGLYGYEFYRQMRLGSYGIADIVAIRKDFDISGDAVVDVCIIELKNTTLSHDHISQVARYREFFTCLNDPAPNYEVCGVLIGCPTFPSGGDLCFLAQSIPWLKVYEFTINPYEGMKFKHVTGWKFTQDNSEAEDRVSAVLDPGSPEQSIEPAANEAG